MKKKHRFMADRFGADRGLPSQPRTATARPEHALLLLRLSQLLSSSLEIQQVLETLIDEILSLTGAERGFIVVRPQGPTAEGQKTCNGSSAPPEH